MSDESVTSYGENGSLYVESGSSCGETGSCKLKKEYL